MEVLIVLGAIVFGVYWLMTKSKSVTVGGVKIKAPRNASAKKSPAKLIPAWLSERWEMAEKPDAQSSGIFPSWYFEDVSDRQIERIKEEGISPPPYLTKGMASDLIGLKEPLGYREGEILRFFKQPIRGVGESQGRHLVSVLFADPAKKAAFDNRPPNSFQKEFFKWFSISMSKDMTMDQASTMIRAETGRLRDEQSEDLKYWECVEEVVEELNEPDVREEFELKKVPPSVICAAIKGLRAGGKSVDDISGDIDLVIETILEARPDLERS